jgi:hypothetical protein
VLPGIVLTLKNDLFNHYIFPDHPFLKALGNISLFLKNSKSFHENNAITPNASYYSQHCERSKDWP